MNDIDLIENILSLLYKTTGNGISIDEIKQSLKIDDEATIKRIVDRLRSDGICDEDLSKGYGGYSKLVLPDLGHKIITDHGSYSNYLIYIEGEALKDNHLKELQRQNLE